jgi:methyl-accepting chemotaxis protein
MNLVKTVLKPGIWMMRSVNLRVKLIALALFILVPVIGASGVFIHAKIQQTQLARAQIGSAEQVRATLKLIELTQIHRGQYNMLRAGNKAIEPTLLKTRGLLKGQFEAVKLATATSSTQTQASIAALARDFDTLVADLAGLRPALAFKKHTELIASMQTAIGVVMSEGNFHLAADPVVGALAMALGDRMVPWMESLGQARGLGAGMLARSSASTPELGQIKALEMAAHSAKRSFEQTLTNAQSLGLSEPKSWAKAISANATFMKAVADEFAGELPDGDSKAYFALGTEAIKGVLELGEELGSALETRLEGLHQTSQTNMTRAIIAATILTLLLAYSLFAFYVSFTGSLGKVRQAMQAAAHGDLSHPLDMYGRDELAEIGRDLERTCHQISLMVAQIRSDSSLVALTGSDLASAADQLSHRTVEQAASIEQSAATVHEVSTAVKANAQRAAEVDSHAREMLANADQGSKLMGQAVKKMEEINESSQKVNDIVSVIDGIAFQTNILALNAAIEAARAGEAGRGFSVVAAEVRALAQQSAESAQAIRDLIAQSGTHVAEGVAHIATINTTLTTLVRQARLVAEDMTQIAHSTSEQSDALGQMSIAVGSLEEITHRNASMVQESHTATSQLQDRANKLRTSVVSIRLRQGTADEARTLVERARDLARSEGLPAASRMFADPEGGFIDRDLYVFILDREGKFLAHGANRKWVGQMIGDLYPEDGRTKLEAYIAAADKGGDWVQSMAFDPVSNTKRPKLTYVMPVSGTAMIACGVYDYNQATEEISQCEPEVA